MPGKLKRRVTQDYRRDVEHMGRLCTALQLDRNIDAGRADIAVDALRKAMRAISDVIPSETVKEA